ncbi:MAG: bifunctional 23S rRNA (guanine(2069)-N(7))-methyltransferase RlmK/23S rRNA (guanine(2445)-N(2))-methyltransferase RlmL [Pseudomonadota bacterium]
MTTTQYSFFASAAKGLESLLDKELASLNITQRKLTKSGVNFSCALGDGYRVLMWTRLASRVTLELHNIPIEHVDDLYSSLQELPWHQHFSNDSTFAVSFTGVLKGINNSLFAAQRVKDAIVDAFTREGLERPSVDTAFPHIRVSVHCYKGRGTISLDMSGESLHRRGYRQQQGEAPLKETLATALLLRSGWSKDSKHEVIIDPLCGSATLLIEAAMIKGEIAPGILREFWGFKHWLGHDEQEWQKVVNAAKNAKSGALQKLSHIEFIGVEKDTYTLNAAKINVRKAGLESIIVLEHGDSTSKERCLNPTSKSFGLVISNPPYGERLSEKEEISQLYAQLTQKFKMQCMGWELALLNYEESLIRHIGFRWHHKYQMNNGPLACELYCFSLAQASILDRFDPWLITSDWESKLSEQAAMLRNRLQKNQKQLKKWLNKENITCYRWYDADLPEYAAAIDVYEGRLHIQEYQAPKTVNEKQASRRLNDIIHICLGLTEIKPENVAVKRRVKQKGSNQYEKINQTQKTFKVQENGLTFKVNLFDYLDTGLFLDHRTTRQMLQNLSKGKHFLNLFAYTGSASVYAASGGAASTTTVDMSKTYLSWSQDNMQLNGFDSAKHVFVNADCFAWLKASKLNYDVIFLDPPTFSNSKKMDSVLDIQRDHAGLIRLATARLSDWGCLIFSTNFRKFAFDNTLKNELNVEEITEKTLPRDFSRRKNFHHVFLIQKKRSDV